MTGSSFFERKFKKSKAKIIFDFDDAIWHMDISEGNRKFSWLKNPGKTVSIIALSDLVFAGNNYLAAFARQFNDNVAVIPTTLDTNYHVPAIKTSEKKSLCIGWTGSITTIKHFELAVPVLKALKEKYHERIYFKVIGDSSYRNAELGIVGTAWNLENEISELHDIDIGIMPLPDDEWSKGKCGFKALQYMSLEIPPVISPVGVNTEIVTDGINGFLAKRKEEWIEKISLLIEDTQLRDVIGKKARETVMERYSVESQKENYLKYFKMLVEKSTKTTS
jgi:glycosyltransferase involved in cell wall biosynthesis